MELIRDTDFAITAKREARRGVSGNADAFFAGHQLQTTVNAMVRRELCGLQLLIRGRIYRRVKNRLMTFSRILPPSK